PALGVAPYLKAEQRRHAGGMQLGHHGRNVAVAADPLDLLQQRLQGAGAGRLDGLLVLAGGNQVGQQGRGRLALGGGGGSEQFVAPGLAEGEQLVPAAEVAAIGRQRVLGQPGGVDVGVEVGTGGGDGRRPLRAGAAGRQREQQGGKQGGEGSHRREISSGGTGF